MKISPRLKNAFSRFNPLFCLLGGVLALWLGRAAALHALAKLFERANLTDATYAAAPAWLKYLADNAGEVADVFALMLASCALTLLKCGGAFGKPGLLPLLLLPAGAGASAVCMLLLRALDEIRYLPHGATSDAIQYVLWLCLAVFQALWLRASFSVSANRTLACAVSALLQAACSLYLRGAFDCLLVLNALLFGLLSVQLYHRYRSVLPEIALFGGFTLVHRLILGYPTTRGYYMSANILNGGDAGLFASVLTSALLAAALFVAFRTFVSEMIHGKKAAANRKPRLRAKKGG